MQDSTFNKIIGDPNFDPHVILEEALVEFIKNHPTEVAKDRVALKWLVRDSSIIHDIVTVIDINDVEMIPVVFDTIEKISWEHSRIRTKAELIKKLRDTKPDRVTDLLEIIKDKAPSTRLGDYPEKFIEQLAADQIDSLVVSAVQAGSEGWRTEDWKIAIKTTTGFEAFMEALKQRKVSFSSDTFQLVSQCARTATQGEYKAILLGLFADLNSYVCFACGRGTGGETDLIKSLSGYTLHRQKCDPDDAYLSPDEIINGKPKTLSFPCGRCGEVFSTASGLSLHRKACR